MSKSKHLKVGDFVRIVNPVQVKRVGYPKTIRDYAIELDTPKMTRHIERLLDLAVARGDEDRVPPKRADWLKGPSGKSRPGWIRLIAHELAAQVAKQEGFGGRERTIHLIPISGAERLGRMEIVALRDVMTGTYYPPSGGSRGGYFDDYDDYEPGGLVDRKQHRLLCLRSQDCGTRFGFTELRAFDEGVGDYDTQLWVREEDVCLDVPVTA